MEGIKTFFESFKEFIWDIIGYLFPGLYTIILLSICINSHYFLKSQVAAFSDDKDWVIYLFLSYILGYVIYGYSEFKEWILGSRSYTKKKEKEIAKRDTFLKAQEIIISKLPSFSSNTNAFSVRELRNIAMTSSPETDQKIYTFMFRSELSKHVGNVSLTIGLLGLIMSGIKHFNCNIDIFMSGLPFTILYILLVVSYFFLRETRNRFYSIAMSLPFSIYLSKQTN